MAVQNPYIELMGKQVEIKRALPKTEFADKKGPVSSKPESSYSQPPPSQQQQGFYPGMTPQMMAQYYQGMQQYFMAMQQKFAQNQNNDGTQQPPANPMMSMMSGMNPQMQQQMMMMMQQQAQGQPQGQQSPTIPQDDISPDEQQSINEMNDETKPQYDGGSSGEKSPVAQSNSHSGSYSGTRSSSSRGPRRDRDRTGNSSYRGPRGPGNGNSNARNSPGYHPYRQGR